LETLHHEAGCQSAQVKTYSYRTSKKTEIFMKQVLKALENGMVQFIILKDWDL
jgi:hypothetical protein